MPRETSPAIFTVGRTGKAPAQTASSADSAMQGAPRIDSPDMANPFVATGAQVIGEKPVASPVPALLEAFTGGAALLGAFVLAEALAPPVALRNR